MCLVAIKVTTIIIIAVNFVNVIVTSTFAGGHSRLMQVIDGFNVPCVPILCAIQLAPLNSPVGGTPYVKPLLYLLSDVSLLKPDGVNHLATDLSSYNADVAVISKTHVKTKRSYSILEAAASLPTCEIERSWEEVACMCVYIHMNFMLCVTVHAC